MIIEHFGVVRKFLARPSRFRVPPYPSQTLDTHCAGSIAGLTGLRVLTIYTDHSVERTIIFEV